MKRSLSIAAAIGVVALSGCGKYSASCKKSEDLTSPWTNFGFPVDEGRVCESSGKDAKVQFISKDAEKYRGKFDEKFLSSGYSKKECKSNYCVYEKGKESRVQVIVSNTDKWVNVSMHEHK